MFQLILELVLANFTYHSLISDNPHKKTNSFETIARSGVELMRIRHYEPRGVMTSAEDLCGFCHH